MKAIHPAEKGCELSGRNVHFDAACVATLDRDAVLSPKFFVLAKGAYTARLAVAPSEACTNATGDVAVNLRWRLAPPKPSLQFDARQTSGVSLDFTIDAEEQAMGAMSVDVSTHDSCLRVSSFTVEPRGE